MERHAPFAAGKLTMAAHQTFFSARGYVVALIEATMAAFCYVAAIYILRPEEASLYLAYENGDVRVMVLALTFFVATHLFDTYKHSHGGSRLVLTLELCQLLGGILLLQAAIGFIDPELVLPLPMMVVGSVLLFGLLVPWWLFVRPAFWNIFGRQRVICAGYDGRIDVIAKTFSADPSNGTEVVGYVTDGDAPVAGRGHPFSSLRKLVKETGATKVIVAAGVRDNKALLAELMDLKSAGVTISTTGQVYESLFGRIDVHSVDPRVVVFSNELLSRPAALALQSIYTNILGMIVAILSLPLFLLVAITLRMTGSGRVLTRTRCVTLHGLPFNLYRFACIYHRNDGLTRFLRRYRIDGLPQVFNIIRGELSLIGPRAERLEFDAELHRMIPFYRQRQQVKPGVFGWSQLYCDGLPEEDTLLRLEYDLYYIKHVSVVLDAYIVIRAIKYLLSARRP